MAVLASARGTATTRAQIVAEATPGVTPGSPTYKRLPELTIIGGPAVTSSSYRGQGYKVQTLEALNMEWSQWSIDGAMTFDELTYTMASALQLVTPVQQGAAQNSGAYLWTMQPSTSNPDPAATYAVQVGDDINGGWMSNFFVVDGCTWTFSRKEVKLSGTALGRSWVNGVTIAALGSLTEIPKIPVLPSNVAAYLDTNPTTPTLLLPNAWSAELSMTGRWVPYYPLSGSSGTSTNDVQTVTITGVPTGGSFDLTGFPGGQSLTGNAFNITTAALQTAINALSGLNSWTVTGTAGSSYVITAGGSYAGMPLSRLGASGNFTGGTNPSIAVAHTTPGVEPTSSFAGVVEGIPTLGLKVEIEANETSDLFMAQFRNAATKYLHIVCSSPVVAGTDGTSHVAYPYNLQIDIPVQVKQPDKQADQDSVWSAPWTLAPVSDNTLGGFIKVQLLNRVASL